MDEREYSRVVFYSKSDISAWVHLQKSQEILDAIDLNANFELNDYLEFYNIKKYFDNDIFLKKWSEKDKNNYIEKCHDLWKKCVTFFQAINTKNVKGYIEELSFNYDESFWELMAKFKVYENILGSDLQDILNIKPHHIDNLLKHKNFVNAFQEQVREFMLKDERSWWILLDYEKNNWSWFPEWLLNQEQKEAIIISYINSSDRTLVSIGKIPKLRGGFLQISWKTKLLAKKKHEEKIQSFFDGNHVNTFKYWWSVSLSKAQKEPAKIDESKDGLPLITYSVDYFDKLNFKNDPLKVFRGVFAFINNRWLIDLVSKDFEIDGMEWLFSHWDDYDYKTSVQFNSKCMQAIGNIQILWTYLWEYKDCWIEDIINNFIDTKVASIRRLENIQFTLDKYAVPYQDKIVNLYRKLDFFIKQYRCLVDEWTIDFELIHMDTRPVSFSWIPSLLWDRYFYEKSDKLSIIRFQFYSDQSRLFYMSWFKHKYRNFFDFITNEDIRIDDYSYDHQKDVINFLIKEWYLEVDKWDFIRIKNLKFIFLVGELYREWVLNFWAYEEEYKANIIEMERQDLLYCESSLLSHWESDYFDYYLNKSKFQNWPEIRNKNIHGHSYNSEDEAFSDYITSLQMVILLLLKIEYELSLKYV